MRSVVRDRLRAGQSPDEIRAYFVARYGEWILLEPKMTGLNYVLYVVYSYLVNSLNSLPLVDVWTMPLLGLGLALMFNARRPS
jgi:hypothetical protein